MNRYGFVKLFIVLLLLVPVKTWSETDIVKSCQEILSQTEVQLSVSSGLKKIESIATDQVPSCGRAQSPKKNDNRFAKIKDGIKSICERLKLSAVCGKFVDDYFEIASPKCLANSDPSKVASTCVLGADWIFHKLNTDPKCQAAAEKFTKLSAQIAANNLNPRPKTQFELALMAAGGDRTIAIFLVSIPQLMHAGLSSFIGAYADKFSSSGIKALMKNWEKDSPYDRLAALSPPLPELSIPTEISAAASRKSYHFWARAFVSSQLLEKGYNSRISAEAATASAAYYEYVLDWAEHKNDPFFKKLLAAQSDIAISAEGSEFGVGLSTRIKLNRLLLR